MDVPSFDQPHKCKYFYNGSVSHYDLLTNIKLTNHAVPMEELMLTKDEIKSLKSMNMMFLNTQKP